MEMPHQLPVTSIRVLYYLSAGMSRAAVMSEHEGLPATHVALECAVLCKNVWPYLAKPFRLLTNRLLIAMPQGHGDVLTPNFFYDAAYVAKTTLAEGQPAWDLRSG